MALSTDNETLTKELKMAVKMGRNFILSLAAQPADGYLAISKKVIPKSEDVTARKKTQKRVYRGTIFKDGTTVVFETDKKVSPALSLKLKLLIKAQTAFKMKDIELREKPALGAAVEEPNEEAEEEEVQAAAGGAAAREEEDEAQAPGGRGDPAPPEEEEEAHASTAQGGAPQDEGAGGAQGSSTGEGQEGTHAGSPSSGEPAQGSQTTQPQADMEFTEREVYGDGEGPDMVFTESETQRDSGASGATNPFSGEPAQGSQTTQPPADMEFTEREVYGDGEGPDMVFTESETQRDSAASGATNPFSGEPAQGSQTTQPPADMEFTEREVYGDGEGPDMVFTESETQRDTAASSATNPFSGEPAQGSQTTQPQADMEFTEREVYGDGEGPDMVVTESETQRDTAASSATNPFSGEPAQGSQTTQPPADMEFTEREVYGDGEGPDMVVTESETQRDTAASSATNPFSGEPAQGSQTTQPQADMEFTEREVYGDGEGPDMVFTESETQGS